MMLETELDMTNPVAAVLAADLESRYGPMVGGADLARLLGYRSSDAFRQAIKRGAINLPLMEIPRRRGRFALTKDVASWMALCRGAGAKSLAADSTSRGLASGQDTALPAQGNPSHPTTTEEDPPMSP